LPSAITSRAGPIDSIAELNAARVAGE